MRYEFHPQALEEYVAAAKYYTDLQENLGLRFVEAIESAVEQVVTAPN